jgi:hypothetical protein
LTQINIGGLGHLAVSGHVCSRCIDEDRRQSLQHVDQVVFVGNRRARRRGGAR